jgi:hypothetical protein
VNSLWQSKLLPIRDLRCLLAKIVCDLNNLPCCDRVCIVCKEKRAHDPSLSPSTGTEISYMKWEFDVNDAGFRIMVCNEVFVFYILNNKNLSCPKLCSQHIQKTADCKVALQNLETCLQEHAIHSFRIEHQLRYNRNLVQQLGTTECVLHVDFSENYQGKKCQEVQGYHFGGSHPQITIHQGVMYTQV